MKQLFIFALGLFLATSAMAQVPYPFISTPVADLNEPWAMEFLPDGRILVTEKAELSSWLLRMAIKQR